jgi:four helix bundle protein
MKCETLEVWKLSKRLSSDVYVQMIECRDFGFRDQICRSGLSIPSNIAEGMERDSVKERIKYLDIAKGSAAEFVTQVHIGSAINYIKIEKVKEWVQAGEQVLGMLTKLQQNLKTR